MPQFLNSAICSIFVIRNFTFSNTLLTLMSLTSHLQLRNDDSHNIISLYELQKFTSYASGGAAPASDVEVYRLSLCLADTVTWTCFIVFSHICLVRSRTSVRLNWLFVSNDWLIDWSLCPLHARFRVTFTFSTHLSLAYLLHRCLITEPMNVVLLRTSCSWPSTVWPRCTSCYWLTRGIRKSS